MFEVNKKNVKVINEYISTDYTKQYIILSISYIIFFLLHLYEFLIKRKKIVIKEIKNQKKKKLKNFKKYKNIIFILLYAIIAGCYLSFIIIKH